MAKEPQNIDQNACPTEISICRVRWQALRASVGIIDQEFPSQPAWEWAATALPASLLPISLLKVAGITQLHYWVAIHKSEIIGVTGLYAWKSEPATAWIGWTVVKPEWRGQGVGRSLFDYATETARQLQYQKLRVYTASASLASQIYEKRGFHPIQQQNGNTYYELELQHH